jgi:hypothetical protein
MPRRGNGYVLCRVTKPPTFKQRTSTSYLFRASTEDATLMTPL